MDIEHLETILSDFSKAKTIFSKEQIEALSHAESIVSALRASQNLTYNFNAKDLVSYVWSLQDNSNKDSLELKPS